MNIYDERITRLYEEYRMTSKELAELKDEYDYSMAHGVKDEATVDNFISREKALLERKRGIENRIIICERQSEVLL